MDALLGFVDSLTPHAAFVLGILIGEVGLCLVAIVAMLAAKWWVGR